MFEFAKERDWERSRDKSRDRWDKFGLTAAQNGRTGGAARAAGDVADTMQTQN